MYAITHSLAVGDSLDSFNGVTVYNNGPVYPESFGKHYSNDGYYYGKKWQCVEFVKRYYYDVYHHKFPDGFGNASSFYDEKLESGDFNERRGLLQFKNGGSEKPEEGDILVFGGTYGHVAVVTKVTDQEIAVIQQNIYMSPRAKFRLSSRNGCYTVGTSWVPKGWLRRK
jgi:surface antigen